MYASLLTVILILPQMYASLLTVILILPQMYASLLTVISPLPRYETAYWSDRKVLHIQFELSDSGMVYEAGDALGVVPCNPPELVANTLKKLGLTGDEVFNSKAVNGSATVSEPFRDTRWHCSC
jgi:sulfite reductase alpha subunit-like flavoprotein